MPKYKIRANVEADSIPGLMSALAVMADKLVEIGEHDSRLDTWTGGSDWESYLVLTQTCEPKLDEVTT